MGVWSAVLTVASFLCYTAATTRERRARVLAESRLAPTHRSDGVGAYSHIGQRDYQEDRFVIDAAPAVPPVVDAPVTRQLGLIVGVFDGHGGARAAHFASVQMASALRKAVTGRDHYGRLIDWPTGTKLMMRALEMEFDAATRGKRNAYEGSTVLLAAVRRYDVAAVMHEEDAMGKLVDANLPAKLRAVQDDVATAIADRLETPIVNPAAAASSRSSRLAIPDRANTLTGLEVAVVNVGDSRCVLCRREPADDRKDKPLSADHKPEISSERLRIEALGGQVVRRRGGDVWRVYDGVGRGGLAMSRAFGDSFYQDAVPALPDVVIEPFSPFTDLAVVLATDGVWDVLDERAVCDVVRKAYRPAERDKDALATRTARKVVDEALAKGSTDNCTAVVVLVNAKGPEDK